MHINESGRSMIEMLGVLAIAAIITLGGLSGYQMAMKKYRANGIAELIAITSIYAQSHNLKVNSLEDVEDEYDAAIPECVTGLKAEKNGVVKVTFGDSETCAELMKLVGTGFGDCRWKTDGAIGTFNPTGDAVKADGTCA